MSIEFGRPGALVLLVVLPVWWLWVRPTDLVGLLVPRGQDTESLALGGWRGRTAAVFGVIGFGAASVIIAIAAMLVGSWHGG